jgi:hypothetical protein
MARKFRRSRAGRGVLVSLVLAVAALAPWPASASTVVSSQVALDWNVNAVAAVRAAKTMDGVPQGSPSRFLYQTEGLIYMSYVQAAVYDGVMKISHRYRAYHNFRADAEDASPQAAVIAAAYNTLVFYLGDPGNTLAAKYASAIAALPAGERTSAGIAVGQAAAADLEQLRANDGRNAPISDACPTPTVPITAGAWLCAPAPSIQTEQTPWVAVMKPFMLRGDSQFRAPAPPALNSAQYIADFNETKTLGEFNSTLRTAPERDTAWFWNANAINQLNQTLRDFATQRSMDLVDAVHLLAVGEMVPTDAGIACFDSKYHWLLWRPVTAVRADGIATDASWRPLVTTPNHPEYPSQHGCVTAALVDVLAKIGHSEHINATIWGAQGGAGTLTTSRTFNTVQAVDDELVNARVWIGFHYRNSVHAGENLGHHVAAWEMKRFFQSSENDEGGSD